MAEAYPLFVQLVGRPCLVVGGGRVARRKVEGLMAGKARVTVVAPELVEGLRKRVNKGEIVWRDRRFHPSDLDGVTLAFIATDDRSVNELAVREARARGVWVNAADDPASCDFQLPAVLRRGHLTVAVASGGASPALAAWVRDRIDEILPAAMGDLVELSRSLRKSTSGGAGASEKFRELFDSGILEDLARGDWQEADRKVIRIFGRASPVREILARSATEAT